MTVLFIFSSKNKIPSKHHQIENQKKILQDDYKSIAWECPRLLKKMDTSFDLNFDTICQIKKDNWSKGQVSLIGDACDCPSLLFGQGSTLAMVAAYT